MQAPMRISGWLFSFAAGLCLPNQNAKGAGEAARPNIIFILADDLGWNGVGCQGNKDVSTPNIDRLAAQGMRFTRAYAEPQCSPTRAALLSGQWGARTGRTTIYANHNTWIIL